MSTPATEAVARAHREHWSVLVARAAGWLRDLDAAEDCAQDAFAAAVRTWPTTGVPAAPLAWLTTAARNRATDRWRRLGTEARALPALAGDAERVARDGGPVADATGDGDDDGADLLRLVLLCAHPALAPESRLALTLRAVCGVPTAAVARVLLVPEPTAAARITRARKKIAVAGIPLRLPEDDDQRLASALDVANLVLTAAVDARDDDLATRAVGLARALAAATDHPEVRGALALALLTTARSEARTDPDGVAVALADQDRSRWDRAAVAEGLALVRGLMSAPTGRFVLQAAIAAEHARSVTAADTDWAQLLRLHDVLAAHWPTPAGAVARAVAVAEVHGPLRGLAALDEVAAAPELGGWPWLPAAQAVMHRRAGHLQEAVQYYRLALSCGPPPADVPRLQQQLSECLRDPDGHRPTPRAPAPRSLAAHSRKTSDDG